MGTITGRDFTLLLDEIMKAPAAPTEGFGPRRPSIPFDTTPANALDAFWSSLSSELVSEIYREAAADMPGKSTGKDAPPSVQPELIAAELGLDRAMPPKALDQLRRAFAFKNHPDRVKPELRERAMVRMQIANRLIDEAKRKPSGRSR
jgi:hypothetical protein